MSSNKSNVEHNYRGRGQSAMGHYHHPEHGVQANEPARDYRNVSKGTPANSFMSVGMTAADYSRNSARYAARGMSTGKKVLLAIITVIVVLFLAAAAYAWSFLSGISGNIKLGNNYEIEKTLTKPVAGEPYWVLILGSDSREEDTDRARSDVMMLVRVDEKAKQVTLVSMPRDTKVEIEGYGTQKINAAYALGGAPLAIQTVEDFSGIKISHYAEIYFEGFSDLVDELGGVTVNVPEYANYDDIELQPGVQTLNGEEALVFARNRKTYARGDFTRTDCQRILVQALVTKVLSEPATEIPGTIEEASKCFATDMAVTDIIGLALNMQGLTSDDFYSAMAPSTTGMIGGASYTFTYINQWKAMMSKASDGKDPSIDETEAAICGTASTADYELDMNVPLPDDVQSALEKYWNGETVDVKTLGLNATSGLQPTTKPADTTSTSNEKYVGESGDKEYFYSENTQSQNRNSTSQSEGGYSGEEDDSGAGNSSSEDSNSSSAGGNEDSGGGQNSGTGGGENGGGESDSSGESADETAE